MNLDLTSVVSRLAQTPWRWDSGSLEANASVLGLEFREEVEGRKAFFWPLAECEVDLYHEQDRMEVLMVHVDTFFWEDADYRDADQERKTAEFSAAFRSAATVIRSQLGEPSLFESEPQSSIDIASACDEMLACWDREAFRLSLHMASGGQEYPFLVELRVEPTGGLPVLY